MIDRSIKGFLIIGCVTRLLAAESPLAETTNLPPPVPGLSAAAPQARAIPTKPAPQVVTGLLVVSNPAPAVTLAWEPSASSNVISYTVYWGAASGGYTNNASVVPAQPTNNTATVILPARGVTFYFAATAKGSNGLESAFSNEVSYTPPLPPAPPAMRTVVVLVVENKTNLNDQWSDGGLPVYASGPDAARKFWRLRIAATSGNQ
jgi:hypothetical protein